MSEIPKRRIGCALLMLVLLSFGTYRATRPYVFNESFSEHAYCIKVALLELEAYADQHDGKYPVHEDGYGDALLLLDIGPSASGPGYGTAAFDEAKRDGTDVDENRCGRVYVQGLSRDANGEIAILFDKLATPGGDHCHYVFRLFAEPGREVVSVGMDHKIIPQSEWAEFESRQIELLVEAGIPRAKAKALYDQVGPPR